MNEATGRLALPFILPGQAQKELYHNEALARIDLALHAYVEGELSSPPSNPDEGHCWLVGSAASGAWSGREKMIAGWTSGGWRFLAPVPGMSVLEKSSGSRLQWLGAWWSSGEVAGTEFVVGGKKVVGARQPAVPSPSGGTTIDEQARAALAALTAAIKSHGLID
jgi:hypothetical protein